MNQNKKCHETANDYCTQKSILSRHHLYFINIYYLLHGAQYFLSS